MRYKCVHCDLIGASQFASLLIPCGARRNDYSVNLCRTVRHPVPPAGSAKGAVICQCAHPAAWSSAQ